MNDLIGSENTVPVQQLHKITKFISSMCIIDSKYRLFVTCVAGVAVAATNELG